MILVIESGSTNTHWRLLSPTNPKPTDFHSKGINPYYQSATDIRKDQSQIIKDLSMYPIHSIHYYGTGITGDREKRIIEEILQEIGSAIDRISVKNDLESAAISTLGRESGIACILGTGSNSGYFEEGQLISQVPPLGFWLGDEGSGGHLGKQLLLSYLHHELPEDIRNAFVKRFGDLSRTDILAKAYKEAFPNRWFATFSKFLFDHRKHPFVYQLIATSFSEFSEKYLLKYPQHKQVKIHFSGSVAFFFSDILKKVIQSKQMTVGYMQESPMAGLTMFHKQEFN